jgi:hypothetical protein
MAEESKPEAKVRVRFTRFCSPYNAGEVAGFSPAEALALVEREVAVGDGAGDLAILQRMSTKSVLDDAVKKDAEEAPAAPKRR